MNKIDDLIQRIKGRLHVSKEDAVDDIMQYWDDAVDGVKRYWSDTDTELAETIGVAPASITELLDDHRQGTAYANVGGKSGVDSYDVGSDWMLVKFTSGSRYLYTLKSTTQENLDQMKRLAHEGKGLNSYLTKVLGANYAGRNVKGQLLIKPGMEHHSNVAKRINLLEAFRNTMLTKQVSTEAFPTISMEDGGDFAAKMKAWIEKIIAWLHKKGKEVVAKITTGEVAVKQLAGKVKEGVKTNPVKEPTKVKLPGLIYSYFVDNGKVSSGYFVRQWAEIYEPITKLTKFNDTTVNTQNLVAFANHIKDMDTHTEETKMGIYESFVKRKSTEPAEVEITSEDMREFLKIAEHLEKVVIGPAFFTRVMGKFEDLKKLGKFDSVEKDTGDATTALSKSVTKITDEMQYIAESHNHYAKQILTALNRILGKDEETSSNEHFNTVLQTYSTQLKAAGSDGLDPVARQFMKVGLETFGQSLSVANETFDETTGAILSNEDLLSAVKKFFTPSKDKDIYDTVNKGFLQDLSKEVKKYTDPNWVKTHGVNQGETVDVDGANLIAAYDKVVTDFIAECKANRTKQHTACDTAFKNMDEVMGMIKGKKLTDSENVRKAITILKATRQIKSPRVEVPKVSTEVGKVKTLTPQEITEKANKLLELFTTLGADTTYVERWNKDYINSHAWMDWTYVGKSNYSELYDQVKDPKFTELYQKTMEHVYDMTYIGAEFHKLRPYVMAVFQLIEKSVEG